MPSDLAKKKAAKKKEAAKARQRTKKTDDGTEDAEQAETELNGAQSNGEGIFWIKIIISLVKFHFKTVYSIWSSHSVLK